MSRTINSNYYNAASTLIRISLGLFLLNYFIDYLRSGSFGSTREMYGVFLTVALTLVIALLIRKEVKWIRWVYLVLVIIGIGVTAITKFEGVALAFRSNIIIGSSVVLQNALDFCALVLLFLPNKKGINNPEDAIEPINSFDV